MVSDPERSGQPRDALFRSVFGDPVHAASELRSALPARLLADLDLTSLRAVPGSFVDPALRQRHTDALFTTRWDGRDALLYVLLEHQSRPDPLMAFRMLRYQVRIWEQHLARHPEVSLLPAIVPVVIYQGQRRWNVSAEFADLLDVEPGLGDRLVVPAFRYLLDDLSGIEAPTLRARPLTEEARVALALLGLPMGFQDLDATLGRWLDHLTMIASHPGGQELLARFAAYVWNTSDAPVERMREFMATMEPEVAETFVSTLDRAVARSRAEGQVELFARQLTLKFGDLDQQVGGAVSTASPEQILAWSARLIDGTLTLEDITG